MAKEMTLGVRIQRARKRLGLTQAEIAEPFGISVGAVSNWERGQNVPEPDKLPVLRKLLKVSYSWLLEGQDAPPDPDDPISLIDDLPSGQKQAVGGFIAGLAKRHGRVA